MQTAAATPTNEARIEALEIFMQHLVLVLECEPHFTAAGMAHWMEQARERMRTTASAAPSTDAALARLQQLVLS